MMLFSSSKKSSQMVADENAIFRTDSRLFSRSFDSGHFFSVWGDA